MCFESGPAIFGPPFGYEAQGSAGTAPASEIRYILSPRNFTARRAPDSGRLWGVAPGVYCVIKVATNEVDEEQGQLGDEHRPKAIRVIAGCGARKTG